MGRPLVLTSLIHNLQFISMPLFFVVVLAMLLSVFSVISFLCGKEYKTSEAEETSTGSKETKLISKLNRNLSSRALSMVKMVSWRKVKPESEDEEEDYGDPDEEVLWRKNILMGERCRPIDFSEKILYDSEENVHPNLSNQNDKYQH